MLAAMPPTRASSPDQGESLIRDRGDACPGALRLHLADDGRLARLRLPGGLLTSRQAAVLGTAAERLADGNLSVTSRGNIELRGLGDACGGELSRLLADAGLLPSERHERVRNVLASPLAGTDGLGHADVQLWARELDGLLCAREWTTALSGRFLFALDDGRADLAGIGADVTLIAESGGTAVVRVGGGAFRIAGADAPRAALAAAGAFLDAVRAAGNGAWRVTELPAGQDVDLAGALERADVAAERTELPDTARGAPPVPGAAGHAVAVNARIGRVTVAQWRALLPLPADELRVTPWRGFVLPGFADAAAARDRLGELAAAGYVTTPDSPWLGVGACTGRPGCAKSLADVRADVVPGPGGLPVHWSGCERRCGHPRGDWADVLATGDGRYEVTVRTAGDERVPVTGATLTEQVTRARTTKTTTTSTR
ncbi:cobalamin biosynthesis protein CobG [Streptomyces sp. NPDC058308]|uniref:cobalamin biosynthesis protein CobG n=1 Tax=Streptomyces sp. NPDC058308 TaxID=3346440 RepID=UPI0036E43EEC